MLSSRLSCICQCQPASTVGREEPLVLNWLTLSNVTNEAGGKKKKKPFTPFVLKSSQGWFLIIPNTFCIIPGMSTFC
uniref:Uncharacterized protein n=1 Tax=Anguilla anguilla TaxID=7936 RepID=A0A0E9STX1_ANGAN